MFFTLFGSRTSAVGQERPIHDVQFESAYPPIASESLHRGKCRDGPRSDIDLLAPVRVFYPGLNAAERRELTVHAAVLRSR